MDPSNDNSFSRSSNAGPSYEDLPNTIERLVGITETLVYEWQQDRLERQTHQIQNLPPYQQSDTDYFRRVAQQHPSPYDGNPDPKILENWLREFEKLFSIVRCPKNLKVNIASYYLKDQADMWWSYHHTAVFENPEYNWEQFTQDLRNKFYPLYLKSEKFKSLLI